MRVLTQTMMDPLERLVAVDAIRTLKARYFRFVDTKAWDDLEALFTPEARFAFPEARAESFSLQEFTALMRTHYDRCVTVHHGHTPEIDVLGPDRASGVWAMQDARYFPLDDPGAPGSEIFGAGHYHETYERHDGAWRISALKLTRLRLDTRAQPRSFA